jgi:hypothetical protein
MTSKGRATKIRVLGSFCVAAAVILAAVIAGGADKVPFPRPDSHKGNWAQSHGMSAQLNINEAGQTGSACLTCHEKGDCISCHSTRMPKDHNNFWRTRGHGLTAGVNRERCLACHRQDYCIRCHNETAPRSHAGTWRTRHCTWCHFASGITPADSCGVCHKIAPHTSRPSAHPPIGAQTNCAACHS